MPPSTWAITYGMQLALPGSDRRTTRPMDTAGFKWQPEIGPMAKAIVSTVSPKASATPSSPIPTCGNAAASTALPQPPNTSQNVPRNSAAARLVSDIETPLSLSFITAASSSLTARAEPYNIRSLGDSRSRTLAPRPPLGDAFGGPRAGKRAPWRLKRRLARMQAVGSPVPWVGRHLGNYKTRSRTTK